MEFDIETLKNNYNEIEKKIINKANECNRNPTEIKILAVSKTHSSETILNGIQAGIPIFAENYAQEFRDKNREVLDYYKNNNNEKNIEILNFEWHFIGHLQSNKVKYLVPFVTTIHTVDTVALAKEISLQAEKYSKNINVLLQVNTSEEVSKSGIEPNQCVQLAKEILLLKNIELIGLMTIGTFSENEIIIRKEFSLLRNCLNEINQNCGTNLKELSMGMSHDYEIAIEEQATMLRIGTAIFGNR
jgi:PLP dependent protein